MVVHLSQHWCPAWYAFLHTSQWDKRPRCQATAYQPAHSGLAPFWPKMLVRPIEASTHMQDKKGTLFFILLVGGVDGHWIAWSRLLLSRGEDHSNLLKIHAELIDIVVVLQKKNVSEVALKRCPNCKKNYLRLIINSDERNQLHGCTQEGPHSFHRWLGHRIWWWSWWWLQNQS